jgi:hypothetical protein
MAVVKINEVFLCYHSRRRQSPSYKMVFFPDDGTCKVTSMYESGRNESRTYDFGIDPNLEGRRREIW